MLFETGAINGGAAMRLLGVALTLPVTLAAAGLAEVEDGTTPSDVTEVIV